MDLINIANIKVSPNIYKLINEKIIPGTNVTKEKFWNEFSSIIEDLSKKNETLLRGYFSFELEKVVEFKINSNFSFWYLINLLYSLVRV